MILSDNSIIEYIKNGEIKVIPGENENLDDILSNIACASFDLRLWNYFKKFPKTDQILNLFENSHPKLEDIYIKDGEYLILQPWEFVLWITKERIWISDRLVARVEWRSSIGRMGILIHVTAWFIDPGFGWNNPSTITLEIKNINTMPVALKVGHRICQIAFELLDKPSKNPYYCKSTAKYNWQLLPQESKISEDKIKNI